MKAGQRPMPTHLKLLRGNPGKQRCRRTSRSPTQADDVPESAAVRHRLRRRRMVDRRHRAASARAVDEDRCRAARRLLPRYGQWRMAAESLAKMQANDPIMNGMIIKTKYGDAAMNPLVIIVRKHAGDMVRFAAEFGLTPAARRTRINAGTGDNSQSKFAGLIAG